MNGGLHFTTDDLYMACDPSQDDGYLNVFQKIYEESGHGGHFRIMMGEDYVPLPVEDADEFEKFAKDS